MAMSDWQVGDVTITRVLEGETRLPPGYLFPDASDQAIGALDWLAPHFIDAEGRLLVAIQALVVRTPSKLIVVDTCLGNERQGRRIPRWNDLQGPFLDDLQQAGIDREAVDVVLCTHLHADHVGWNTMLVDGVWTPTFPNARYLISEAEFAHWSAQREDSEVAAVFADSLVPIMDAGLMDLVATDHCICEGVRLSPTPGHTPGHVSVCIESRGERALITGDFIHHPCQMAHPDWREIGDVNVVQSEATRRAMLATYADRPVLVIGTHFAGPAAGRVVSAGAAYRFEV
jgi:glyoxylase-like metal-dependent hydrolase (beta-lactamase superfamily II)